MFVFEWFSLAFGDPKEQARLFMVLISTSLAITILLLNQWFISNRAKKERRIEKLEELTTAIHGFYSACNDVNCRLYLAVGASNVIINPLNEFTIQIDKLNALYFQDSPICTILSNEISDEVTNEITANGTIPRINISDSSYRHMNNRLKNWFEDAMKTINILTKKHIK
jgi:hypothetical protein